MIKLRENKMIKIESPRGRCLLWRIITNYSVFRSLQKIRSALFFIARYIFDSS